MIILLLKKEPFSLKVDWSHDPHTLHPVTCKVFPQHFACFHNMLEKPLWEQSRKKTLSRYLRHFLKCRCFHYQFIIAIFRFCAILGVMEMQLVSVRFPTHPFLHLPFRFPPHSCSPCLSASLSITLPSSSLHCLVADRLPRPDCAPERPGVKAGWKVKWLHGGFTSIIRM